MLDLLPRPTLSLTSRIARLALIAPLTVLLSVSAMSQKKGDVRPNDPSTDPYTEGGKAELLEAAEYSSLGGFEFATTDTNEIDKYFGDLEILWVETEHFELGMALGPQRVREDAKKVEAELNRLAEKLPAVGSKIKKRTLDPWLRTHVYAQRLEDAWDLFVEILQVDPAAFPDGSKLWDMTGKYMGEGPYLGQKGKYEVLILPSEAVSVQFLNRHFGLKVRQSQRWNIIERDTLITIVHTGQGQLKKDNALHGHLVFNLTINLFDGFKHYSYESPIWIREGLAHYMERRLDPRFNSFDSSEGSVAEMTRKTNWGLEVKKLIRKDEAPRMAKLVNLKTYAELKLPHHFTTWSFIDFLHSTNPEGLAKFLDAIKGRTNEQGFADGTNLSKAHRDAIKEIFGWSYPQFDAAWAEWALENY